MNEKSANRRGARFFLRFDRYSLTIVLLLYGAGFGVSRLHAAPNSVVATVGSPSLTASREPAQLGTLPVPAQYTECLGLLRSTERVSPALVERVGTLLNHPADSSQAVPQRSPSLLVVTVREQGAQARDVVVQAYFEPLSGGASVLNSDGYVRSRLGDELSGSADQLLGLMYHQVVYFGAPDQVEHEQRAFKAALNGDLTLLREETIDPMRVLIVMPHGGAFLPSSLRSRVRGLVVDADLSFGTWRTRVGMVTADADAAQQVAGIVEVWRDMAMSLADTFASHSSGKQLRESLKSSTVQVADNRVVASASVDTRTVVRTAKEISGHGGGCPSGGVCSGDKVAICHNIDKKHDQTLCVAPAAVAAHLAQGDQCGPCAE